MHDGWAVRPAPNDHLGFLLRTFVQAPGRHRFLLDWVASAAPFFILLG